MSKSQLQTNNTRLSQLITELQGKAAGGGSGGSVETCTVTFATGDPFTPTETCIVIYVGADGQAQSQQWIPGSTVITVIKGSHVVVVNWNMQSERTNTDELYLYSGACGVYKIIADAVFTYYM